MFWVQDVHSHFIPKIYVIIGYHNNQFTSLLDDRQILAQLNGNWPSPVKCSALLSPLKPNRMVVGWEPLLADLVKGSMRRSNMCKCTKEQKLTQLKSNFNKIASNFYFSRKTIIKQSIGHRLEKLKSTKKHVEFPKCLHFVAREHYVN